MEQQFLEFLIASGDTGVLMMIALLGYHKLGTRLTVIETILKENHDHMRMRDDE